MTVPSERDALPPTNERALHNVMMRALTDDTSWCDDFGDATILETARRTASICARAALEAQHTRDEEARELGDETARLMGRAFRDYLIVNQFDGSTDGRLDVKIRSLLDDLEEDFVDFMLNRARAYVQQSDQGEKGDAR